MAQLFMGSKTFRMKQLPIFLIYTSRTILDFGSSSWELFLDWSQMRKMRDLFPYQKKAK